MSRLHSITEGISTATHRTPLLFVHGAWHSSWCWQENFIPFFAREGFACQAFDLRGHGQSEGWEELRTYHLLDYVADLAQIVDALAQKPILIGHSMGGMISQKYAQDHDVAGLVLLASGPANGTGYGSALKHPVPFMKFLLTRRGKAMISGQNLAKSLFFSPDIPDAQFVDYYGKLQDESYTALIEIAGGLGWKPLKGSPPLLVVEAGRDAVIPRKRLEETARLYGTKVVRVDDVAHDLMIDVRWRQVADLVNTWLLRSGF